MASGAVSAAIEDFLGGVGETPAAWTVTPLLFENKVVDQGGNALPRETPEPFVSVEFTGRSYGQVSIGASLQADNRWDEEGMLFLDVFWPVGTGSREARAAAKQLTDKFRGLTLLSGNLEFGDAAIGSGAKSEKYNGNYFVIPVDIEWRRVEA